MTIKTGVNLTVELKEAFRAIEAERLLTKLAEISNRVHGPKHRLTKDVVSKLELCKVRIVLMRYENEWEAFQPIRYEDEGGRECVVKGPLKDPPNPQKEKILTVRTEELILTVGTPVECRGLGGMTNHLNGKIGDIRSWNDSTGCCEVHFEDGGLEPGFVKPENLRIVMELPEEK